LIGALPRDAEGARILWGLREDRLAAAIWFKLESQTGIISGIIVARTALWQSDVQEPGAEASLWLTSRGVTRIELKTLPQDSALQAGLRDMHFLADEHAGTICRLWSARTSGPSGRLRPCSRPRSAPTATPMARETSARDNPERSRIAATSGSGTSIGGCKSQLFIGRRYGPEHEPPTVAEPSRSRLL